MAWSTGNYCFFFFFLSLSTHSEVNDYSRPLLHLGFTYPSLEGLFLSLISGLVPPTFQHLPHNVCIWYTCHRYFGVQSEAFHVYHVAAGEASLYSFY